MQGVCTPAGGDTTSELPVGNGRTGAPVTVPMSDGAGRNQGGTVEYFCIPPLYRQGMGLFLYPPQSWVMLNSKCKMQNKGVPAARF